MECCFSCSDVNKVESLPKGWQTVSLIFKHRDGRRERRIEVIDPKNNRYWHEPMAITALKCFELLIGIPLYLALYTSWHLLRTPITAVATLVSSFSKFVCHPCKSGKQFLVDLVWTIPKILIQGIWTIVRAPFYAIAMEFAALYGLFRPCQGKALVGQAERAWHQKVRTKDIRYVDPEAEPFYLAKALGKKDFSDTFFLAFCMQSYGNLSDGHIEQGSIQRLQPKDSLPNEGLIPVPVQ